MDNTAFLAEGSTSWFSLTKLIGQKIVDIEGYPADPFEGTPIFKIVRIVFEDGTRLFVEGEHDLPYLPSDDKLRNMSEEALQRFIESEEEDEQHA